jgi:DNA-nicking Smr family endonuclease
MPKQRAPSKDDIETFQEAVKGTKPLKQAKDRVRPTPPKAPVRVRKKSEEPDFTNMLDESADLAFVDGEQSIHFHRPGLQNKILRNFRKGQYNIEAILDLHGMTVEKAQHAVDTFLRQCIRDDSRVVLIIHGKGHHGQHPTLKNKLNYWLRNIKYVLAFCSATYTHGSRGALYVLLKRRKEENLLEQ